METSSVVNPKTELKQYYLITNYLSSGIEFEHTDLSHYQERHKVSLDVDAEPVAITGIDRLLQKNNINGVIIEVEPGLPGRSYIKTAKRILAQKIPVWFYWRREKGLESLNAMQIQYYQRLWLFMKGLQTLNKLKLVKSPIRILEVERDNAVREFLANVAPVDFPQQPGVPAKALRFTRGAYLRTDFWVKINAGGSYGHTCYLAKELAKHCDDFVCFFAHEYPLLNQFKVRQIELGSLGQGIEENFLDNTHVYQERLRALVQLYRPDFFYERICLGGYVGATLSKEYGIPYIVEYNGSEIEMKRSFDQGGFRYENYFLKCEMAAFKQATAINVISQVVANELIRRGIPKEKILINPNGADPDLYRPVSTEAKTEFRQLYNWNETHTVIGFVGTFGGWHGIEVLAAALPRVCAASPNARFLLIGDGNFRHLIDEAVTQHNLQDKVILTGSLPQVQAIPFLKMCDVYVAPHSCHMKNQPFFGSPTKLFEYMALGGGIVASDLMQIGDVLRPAISANDISTCREVTNEMAILCEPGNLEQFVKSLIFLCENPGISRQLGANARKELLEKYTWQQHVDRLLAFLNKAEPSEYTLTNINSQKKQDLREPVAQDSANELLVTKLNMLQSAQTDAYKEQTQQQWNQDPCGSHYVKDSKAHTLEWYIEVERYRYQEYAPWMESVMGFRHQRGKKLLEVGGGLGTDLAQFAKHGAITTDLDLSHGHLTLAQENFKLRGLSGEFKHGDAERMPFPGNTFDVVYSCGVIHHSPNTAQIVSEMYRVLKPGGMVKIMVYAEYSLNFWLNQVHNQWWKKELFTESSIGELMSHTVELSEYGAKPLVKVYNKKQLLNLFSTFERAKVVKRQLMDCEKPKFLKSVPTTLLSRLVGWNLIITAYKPN